MRASTLPAFTAARCRRDAVAYGLAALFAAVSIGLTSLPSHREWAALAVVPYLAGAVASLRLARRGSGSRAAVLAAVVAGVVVVPIAVLAVARAGTPLAHAQEEVAVVEAAGRLLVATGSPYLGPEALGASHLDYFPYLPGMAVFGLPSALLGEVPLADARVWFLLATVGLLWAAARVARLDRDRTVTGAQVLLALPWAALTLATGGDDLPVIAMCVLAVALAGPYERPRGRNVRGGHAGRAGLVAGAAAACKLFAWPLVLVLALVLLRRGGREALTRFAAGAAGVVAAVAGPVLLLDAGALVVNVLRFPFGLTPAHSPAGSPLPGWLLATYLPHGRLVALTLLGLAAVLIAGRVLLRPPATPAGAAAVAGAGLAVAMLLAPATRYGYALYPIALLTTARLLGGPAVPELVESGRGRAPAPVVADAGAAA